jgi:hypothetical protein
MATLIRMVFQNKNSVTVSGYDTLGRRLVVTKQLHGNFFNLHGVPKQECRNCFRVQGLTVGTVVMDRLHGNCFKSNGT